MRTRWLLATLALSVAIAAIHLYASENFWYWRYRWFDTPMHVLGGITIGALVVFLLGKDRPSTYIIIVAAIAIGWEIFEYAFGLTHETGYALDTIHDLANDAVGAGFIYFIARSTIWRPASEP